MHPSIFKSSNDVFLPSSQVLIFQVALSSLNPNNQLDAYSIYSINIKGFNKKKNKQGLQYSRIHPAIQPVAHSEISYIYWAPKYLQYNL